MATAGLMRGYGGQSVMLMRNESNSDSLVAMLASCNPHVGIQGPRSVGGLELDAAVGCGQKRPYYGATYDGATVEDQGEDVDDGGDDFPHHVEKKRRLTGEQVRSLERNFEMENKLEPERKMLLARELGLQPRQVAVWFQNRRARSKTKQLERDYEVLTLDYKKLKADLAVIRREKYALKTEVQRLLGKTNSEESQGCESLEPSQCGSETTSTDPSHPPSRSDCFTSETRDSDLVSSRNTYLSRSSSTTDVTSKKEQATSSGAGNNNNSCEILDPGSARTTDSRSNFSTTTAPHDQPASTTYCHGPFPPETLVGPNMLHVDADLCSSNPRAYQVKLEVGCSFPDQYPLSCNYLFPHLDEQSVLPWWDLPGEFVH